MVLNLVSSNLNIVEVWILLHFGSVLQDYMKREIKIYHLRFKFEKYLSHWLMRKNSIIQQFCYSLFSCVLCHFYFSNYVDTNNSIDGTGRLETGTFNPVPVKEVLTSRHWCQFFFFDWSILDLYRVRKIDFLNLKWPPEKYEKERLLKLTARKYKIEVANKKSAGKSIKYRLIEKKFSFCFLKPIFNQNLFSSNRSKLTLQS